MVNYNTIKLFGPRSYAYGIHRFLKTVVYLIAILRFFYTLHLIMGWLDYLGLENPIAALQIEPTHYYLHYKLISAEAVLIPLSGGATTYLIVNLETVLLLVLDVLLIWSLSSILRCLSQQTIFMTSLVKSTRILAWVLIIKAIERGIAALYLGGYASANPTDLLTLLFTGVMIWFLSRVFAEGEKMQQEIDLTI